MRRIAYDADTQQYTFCDHSGRLYESAPGSKYGVLMPVEPEAPLARRRNVTIIETPDPALRQWSEKPAKTFDDILPSGYITAAKSGIPESPTRMISPGEKLAQTVMPKVQGVVEVVRRHTTMRRQKAAGMGSRVGAGTGTGALTGKAAETGAWGRARSRTWQGTWDVKRMGSLVEEKNRLLEDEGDGDGEWEVVRRSDAVDGRLARSKSEIRPSRYAWPGRK